MYFADAHTHSHHSLDGRDDILLLAQGALRSGLSALCVTDHYDTWSDFDPDAYWSEYKRARPLVSDPLDLLFGVELGEGHTASQRAEALLDAVPFDFVLGSLHCLRDKPDFHDLHYESVDQCRALIERYLDELLEMIAWGRFDVLGHLTYPLRYMAGRENIAVDFLFCEDRLRAIFRALIESDLGMEVNVSGLRRNSFVMPDLHLLKLYRQCGGKIVTVGSDAHTAMDIGSHIVDGYALLREAGFSHVSVFRQRKIHYYDL